VTLGAATTIIGSALLLPLLACGKSSRRTPARADGEDAAFASATEAGAPIPGELFSGSKKLTAPSDCKTALLETTSCRGEDRSFQECLYYFRADGVPQPDVCHAFLKVADSAVAADAGVSGCNERSPAEWKRIACGGYKLPADYTCFACSSDRPETSRQLVQAFTAACDRAIVLKGCNVDLTTTTLP
jgi:hypothetical protein